MKSGSEFEILKQLFQKKNLSYFKYVFFVVDDEALFTYEQGEGYVNRGKTHVI